MLFRSFIDHEHAGGLPVLIGGESSGGISVLGHIPEKDGILANLVIAELIAMEGKQLGEILKKVQASVSQQYVFRELGVKTLRGKEIMSHFQGLQGKGGEVAGFKIDTVQSTGSSDALEQKYGTRDGAKVFFEDGSWLLIRASGTEPIARVYVEGVAGSAEAAFHKSQVLLEAVTTILSGDFDVPHVDIKEKK